MIVCLDRLRHGAWVTCVVLLMANVIYLLLNVFASWALKVSGESNTISWGEML